MSISEFPCLMGYHVIGKSSPGTALAMFQAAPDNYVLIVADMTMPKMTGLDLAKEVLQRRKDIPFILCTGFGVHINEGDVQKYGVKGIIYKLILMRDMAEKIRTVLDQNVGA